MLATIGEALRRRAWIAPKTEALVDLSSGERLSYPQLNDRVNRLANALTGMGVARGDKIALLCLNGVEFVETYYAAAKVGAVVVPLNWRLTVSELTYILADSESRMLIFGADFGEAADAIHADRSKVPGLERMIEVRGDGSRAWAERYDVLRESGGPEEPATEIDGDDLLTIVYTSGTTGLPKGVVHTHRTAMAGIVNALFTFEFGIDERYLVVLPLFHVGASTPLLLNLFRGSTVVLMSQFDPAAMWQAFEKERITSALAVPAMLKFMLQVPDFQSFDHSHLRGIITGAAPVPVELINAYMGHGIEIHQVYGMTESFGPGCYLAGAEAAERLGSTGKGYLMTDVRLVDTQGRDVQPGTPGQILLRGDHNMVGYWNNPAATAETLIDGWLHTGDIGIADEDGYITVHDRLKDMIISGGENVYPAEIENVLLSHPQIVDAAVIGQPSEKWGESPFAVVVSKGGAVEKSDVLDHCRNLLAGFKLPKDIAFVDEIPRNPTGKALKKILRDSYPGPAPE